MAIVESLRIEQAKIEGYLLDVNHADGGDKAAFFLSRGFRTDTPEILAEALATHAAMHWPGVVKTNAYVTKHIVEGPLRCPDGSTPNVLAVWKLEAGRPAGRPPGSSPPTADAEGSAPCASPSSPSSLWWAGSRRDGRRMRLFTGIVFTTAGRTFTFF